MENIGLFLSSYLLNYLPFLILFYQFLISSIYYLPTFPDQLEVSKMQNQNYIVSYYMNYSLIKEWIYLTVIHINEFI